MSWYNAAYVGRRISFAIGLNGVVVVGIVDQDLLSLVVHGEELDVGSATTLVPKQADRVEAVRLSDDIEDRVGCPAAPVEFTGNDSHGILGVGAKGDLEAVIAVDTERVQALGQLQIAQHFGHDAIRTVSPTRDLGNCLILAEVADAGSLILVPVDYTIHLDRRDTPALPGVRVGLIQVRQGIVVIVNVVRIEQKTGQLLLGIGGVVAVNVVCSVGLRGADLRHIGDEAGGRLVNRCGGKAGRQPLVIHIHGER